MSTPSTAHDRSFDRILARLERVKKRGDTATASCPCHKDLHPSLSLRYMPDTRRTLLNCFSQQCTEADITAALGLEPHDVYDEPLGECEVCGKRAIPDDHGRYIHDFCAENKGKPKPQRTQREQREKPRRLGPLPRLIAQPEEPTLEVLVKLRETDRYEHIDSNGEVVAASVRLEEVLRGADGSPVTHKTFYQEYTDGHGGTQKTKPEGLRVPLWCPHEVHLAVLQELPVWLTEGHKDAKAIQTAGGTATTNISGALNFTADDAEDLRDAHVNIVCDRDAVGFRRALIVGPLLEGVAASVTYWLPATLAPKSDAYDHLAAGFDLEQFVLVDVTQLQVLELLAIARGGKNKTHRMRDLAEVARESAAHWQRSLADQDNAPKRAAEGRRLAHRWALEAGDHLRALHGLREKLTGLVGARPHDIVELDAIIADATGPVAEIYRSCEATVDDDLVELLNIAEDNEEQPDADVILLPTSSHRRVPAHRIQMTDRDEWRYDDGANTQRGVYRYRRGTKDLPGEWIWMAELPHVTARVIRRDGRGQRTSMSYMLAMNAGDTPVPFNADALRSGSWANALGIALSYDPKVIQAVATAITVHAKEAPECESTPRLSPETGRIDVPAEKPDQYFETHPQVERTEGLEGWRAIVAETAAAPKLAHMMGASAIAPFVHALGVKSHTFSVTGAAQRGKTQGLRVAAGIWGNSIEEGNAGSLFGPWNLSHMALPQLLGELGMLPIYRDEGGLAKMSKQQWAQIIYSVSEGVSRARTDLRAGRASIGAPWHGILFTTSNARLTEGIDSGENQGIPRRVVELDAPITADAEQALRLINSDPTKPRGLLNGCYGHLGLLITETIDTAKASHYLRAAHELRPLPEGDVADVARMLLAHLAGSLMIDDLLGTGDQLTQSTLIAIDEYLAEWAAPETEAERLLALISESMVSMPAAWPRIDDYLENAEARPFGDSNAEPLPGHGILATIHGILDRDGSVCVMPGTWTRFGEDAGINLSLAAKQLEADEILVRSSSAKKGRGTTFQSLLQLGRGSARKMIRCYRLFIPDEMVDDPTAEPPTPPATGPEQHLQQETPLPATGANMPVTTPVTGATGVTGAITHSARKESDVPTSRLFDRGGHEGWSSPLDPSQPCTICSKPSGLQVDGLPIHSDCWEASTRAERARQQVSAPASETWAHLPEHKPCVVCAEPAGQALAGLPLHMGECAETVANRTKPVTLPSAKPAPTTPPGPSGERFVSDSVVLDVDGGWLTNGTRIQPPAHITHAGDLVEWAATNRIGWGGNRNHRPEAARVWLAPAMCEQLGLPSVAIESIDEAEDALRTMRQTQFFTAATAAGWNVTGAVEKPWIKLYRGNQSAVITGMTWGNGRYDALLLGDPTPAELAQRLGVWCRTVKFPWSVTPSQTGLQSIAYATTHGMPAVTIPDIELNDAGANPQWFDQDAVEAFLEEHGSGFAHVFDRRRSYLASAGNAILGSGDPIHHPHGTTFERKIAGIYRLAPLTDQPLPWLRGFDALNPAGQPEGTSGWTCNARLSWLLEHDIDVEILEAYTWPEAESRPQLKQWQATMRDAGDALDRLAHEGDPHAQALVASRAYKGMYAGGIGALAQTNGRDPLQAAQRYYPHWRAEIVGYHTTNTLRAVERLHTNHPAQPVPVAIGDTDAVVYLGTSTDPADVWPGTDKDSLTSRALGKFKPKGFIAIDRWLDALTANQNAARPVSVMRLITDHGTNWDA